MRNQKFYVYFKNSHEFVQANNKLDALMIAMLRRVDMKDQFAKYIVDECGIKYNVDNAKLLGAISITYK